MPFVTLPNTAYPASTGEAFRKLLSATLMKNWLVAEFGLLVRAIAKVPRVFLSPLLASFLIAGRVAFSLRLTSMPPP